MNRLTDLPRETCELRCLVDDRVISEPFAFRGKLARACLSRAHMRNYSEFLLFRIKRSRFPRAFKEDSTLRTKSVIIPVVFPRVEFGIEETL